MNFFFGIPFWGIFLILIGLSLVLKSFGLHIPLGRIFLGIVIIVFGIKILVTSGKVSVRSKTTKHGNSYYKASGSGEYSLVFSSGTIDLRELKEDSGDIEVTVVFASATVILPEHLSFKIEPTTVFGTTSTGNVKKPKIEGVRPIKIESSCVFGSLEYVTDSVENAPLEQVDEEVEAADNPGEF